MVALWRRLSASLAGCWFWSAWRPRLKLGAMLLQAEFAIVLDTSFWHLAIAAYLAAMALDEIDFHSLLGGVAEKRFQQIAMSLGDGLVCVDQNGLITVWNPGAVAIFGYQPEEMIGQPFGRICALGDDVGNVLRSRLLNCRLARSRCPAARSWSSRAAGRTARHFRSKLASPNGRGIEGFQYGAVMRDISARKREAERIQYLAEHDTLTGLANRNTLYEHLGARLAEAERGAEPRSRC